MDQQLYRQKSLDRISSPEQLNDYLRVTSPSVWIILAAIIFLLAGLLFWSYVTTIESYVSGNAEVKGSVMTIRFDDQQFAKNVKVGMSAMAGDTQSTITGIGRDENGLYLATASTGLADGFYPVRVRYKQTQVLQLLFD